MDRFLSELSVAFSSWKVAASASVATFLADAAAEVSGYENIGTKALLLGAIVWLVRQLQVDRADARMREDKLNDTIDANTKALDALKTETAQQTQYYREVVRTIVDREIKKE